MNYYLTICLILGIGYFIYLIIESFLIRYYRKHIKCVIHVNGIRGKSTITRLIDASLREFGFNVMSKTTGTIPTIIDKYNNEIVIKRFAPSNIREQVRILRKAYKDKIDYLILECMAVTPELQKACEENILKANITIISNIREDHIGEMGNNKIELAKALSLTVPSNGYLITSPNELNSILKEICDQKNTKFIETKEYKGEDFDTFNDNIAIALEVANILNLDKDTYLKGLAKYKKDPGALSIHTIGNSTLINGLSINDYESTKIVYDKLKESMDLDELVVLINNRIDRPGRLLSLIKLFEHIKTTKVILTGSNYLYCKYLINKKYPHIMVTKLDNVSDLTNEKVILAIGNIKNKGLEILEYYKKGGN